MTIPKRLHQIWLGPRPAPREWMNTWRDQNPGFDYGEWNDSDVSALGLLNRTVYERYMSERIFDGAADVARVEILYRFGGIYVDADSVAVRPIDDELLEAGFFAVREPESGMVEHGWSATRAWAPSPATRYWNAISRPSRESSTFDRCGVSRALEPSQRFWRARESPTSRSYLLGPSTTRLWTVRSYSGADRSVATSGRRRLSAGRSRAASPIRSGLSGPEGAETGRGPLRISGCPCAGRRRAVPSPWRFAALPARRPPATFPPPSSRRGPMRTRCSDPIEATRRRP